MQIDGVLGLEGSGGLVAANTPTLRNSATTTREANERILFFKFLLWLFLYRFGVCQGSGQKMAKLPPEVIENLC